MGKTDTHHKEANKAQIEQPTNRKIDQQGWHIKCKMACFNGYIALASPVGIEKKNAHSGGAHNQPGELLFRVQTDALGSKYIIRGTFD